MQRRRTSYEAPSGLEDNRIWKRGNAANGVSRRSRDSIATTSSHVSTAAMIVPASPCRTMP